MSAKNTSPSRPSPTTPEAFAAPILLPARPYRHPMFRAKSRLFAVKNYEGTNLRARSRVLGRALAWKPALRQCTEDSRMPLPLHSSKT